MAQLTTDQQRVADHGKGHARVPAVPGAGKTTTMVQLILNKLASGVDPARVRVVMFNRSAQEDFAAKLSKAAGEQHLSLPPVKTFHAMGRSLLLSFIKSGALPPFDPSPMSEMQASIAALNALKECAQGHILADIEEKRQQWMQAFSGFIDTVKAGLEPAAKVFEASGYADEQRIFVSAFERFEEWRRDQGKVTFADLLYEPCLALKRDPSLVQRVENHLDLVITDEFQDVNEIQLFLLRCLAGTRAQVIVVGDADQCIYEFRAARPHYMTAGFGEIYPHQTYTIGQTFRYGHRLALAANHLITNNKNREPVLCISAPSTPDTSIALHNQSSTGDEIADTYGELLRKGYTPQEIVVLCRVWSLSVPVELAFLKRGIHYRVQGGRPVLTQSEIEALITVLHFANGTFYELPRNCLEARLFNFLKLSVQRIKHADLKAIALSAARAYGDPIEALVSAAAVLSTYQAKKIERLAEALRHAVAAELAGDVLDRYVEGAGVRLNIKSSCLDADDGETRVETVDAFMAFVAHQSPGGVPHIVALIDHLMNQGTDDQSSTAVVITTMHRSKGLEWPAVLIPGLDAKHMPYRRDGEAPNPENDESERRLLYVGMTRAKRELHLFAPGLGKADGTLVSEGTPPIELPSPFLAEMNLDLSSEIGGAIHADCKSIENHFSITPVAIEYARTSNSGLRIPTPAGLSLLHSGKALIGRRVVHSNHGLGQIVELRRDGLICDFRSGHRLFSRVVADKALRFAGEGVKPLESSAQPEGDSLSIGQPVDHCRFGKGKIALLDDSYVYVRFGNDKTPKAFRRETFIAA